MAKHRISSGAPQKEAALSLYTAAVEQARHPVFYERFGVPDSVDGRFELLALHVFLIIGRLSRSGSGNSALSQALFDLMFADMDQNLREMGVSDLSVGRHVRRMAEAFYGRSAAYREGLGKGGDALDAALRSNLYGTVSGEVDFAPVRAYILACDEELAEIEETVLTGGRVRFPDPRRFDDPQDAN